MNPPEQKLNDAKRIKLNDTINRLSVLPQQQQQKEFLPTREREMIDSMTSNNDTISPQLYISPSTTATADKKSSIVSNHSTIPYNINIPSQSQSQSSSTTTLPNFANFYSFPPLDIPPSTNSYPVPSIIPRSPTRPSLLGNSILNSVSLVQNTKERKDEFPLSWLNHENNKNNSYRLSPILNNHPIPPIIEKSAFPTSNNYPMDPILYARSSNIPISKRFQLSPQPNSFQRKSSGTEKRNLQPNPFVIRPINKKTTNAPTSIISFGRTTVFLADGRGQLIERKSETVNTTTRSQTTIPNVLQGQDLLLQFHINNSHHPDYSSDYEYDSGSNNSNNSNTTFPSSSSSSNKRNRKGQQQQQEAIIPDIDVYLEDHLTCSKGGPTHDLDGSMETSYSLQMFSMNGTKPFTLLFIIEYVTEDGEHHVEKIVSKSFEIRSSKTLKTNYQLAELKPNSGFFKETTEVWLKGKFALSQELHVSLDNKQVEIIEKNEHLIVIRVPPRPELTKDLDVNVNVTIVDASGREIQAQGNLTFRYLQKAPG